MIYIKRKLPIIVTILIILLGGLGIFYQFYVWNEKDISVSNPVIKQIQVDGEKIDLKTIIHEAEKNVVQIEAKSEQQTLTGSGFLYNDKGDIITNAHVIKDADTIYVRTANARIYPAAVIGIGDRNDVAVLRVPQLAGENVLKVEKDELAEIGDEVIALGSPHGFQNTVTLGIISGTARNFTLNGFDYNNVYQISAQITHGNSGGPLINRNTGKIIGINSVGTEDGTLGFSIPIVDVMKDIENWSNEAQTDQLTFTNTDEFINSIDQKQFLQDTSYIVEYFLDSIIIRDYVAAYSLLGDSLQSTTSYTDFREDYIQVVDLKYSIEDPVLTKERHASILVDVELTKNQPNEEERVKKTIRYQFTVDYENDQLKIIGFNTK
jgi:serine protease Do